MAGLHSDVVQCEMKLKELLLPFALVVLVGAGGEAEAMTAEQRQVMKVAATQMCAHRTAVKADEYGVVPIDRARESVLNSAHTAEEQRNINAFFALVKTKCG